MVRFSLNPLFAVLAVVFSCASGHLKTVLQGILKNTVGLLSKFVVIEVSVLHITVFRKRLSCVYMSIVVGYVLKVF